MLIDKLSANWKYVLAGLTGLSVVLGSYTIVTPGERGVLITLGNTSDTVLNEGIHFKFPFVSSVKMISVRVQRTNSSSEAATKDLQKVTAEVSLNWNLDPSTVNAMYQKVGDEHDIADRIINPAVSEVLKASTAQMNAEEILTRRLELKKTIDEQLIKRLSAYNVIVKDISLVHLDFTEQFNHAIEAKQVAEQRAKQAGYEAEQATQQAKSEVNKARGEAEANLMRARAQSEGQKLLKQNLTADVLQLEYLKKWDGKLPTVLTGSASGVMLNIHPSKNEKTKESENENE